jgi:hypothetical protein
MENLKESQVREQEETSVGCVEVRSPLSGSESDAWEDMERELRREIWTSNSRPLHIPAMSSTWLKFKLCQRFTE